MKKRLILPFAWKSAKKVNNMIITNVEGLRDPFVLVDDGVYYLYGTGVSNEDWIKDRVRFVRNSL